MARVNFNDPRVLDSTGRTTQNGGVMPPTQPAPAKIPLAGTPAPAAPVAPAAVTQPVPTAVQTPQNLMPVPQVPQPVTPPGVQTLGPSPVAPMPQPAPGQAATTGTPLSTTLPSINGADYYAGTGGTPTYLPLDFGSGYVPSAVNVGSTGPVAPVSTSGAGSAVTPVNPGVSQQVAVPTMGTGWNVPTASSSGSTVQSYLNDLLSENGSYLQNASRRGTELANSRGMLNGSIAAGASSRAAIEASQPILDQIMNLNNAREGMSFTQGENALNRTLQERLQAQGFNFEGGQNDLNRGLQSAMQSQNLNFQGQENAANRSLESGLQSQSLNFQGQQADMARQLQAQLQAQGFSFEDAQNAANRMLTATMNREDKAFQGQQNSLDRAQTVNNQVLQGTLQERMAQLGANINSNAAQQDFEFRRSLQSDQAAQQDWLSTNQFNNQFNANLSMIPVTSSMQMLQALSQYALQDPETYTPEVMSGFTNFFNNNMVSLLQQYFPNSGGNQ